MHSHSKIDIFANRIPLWGWYLFWLGIILIIYWPGIIILPKRDHVIFLMERHLADSDITWFFNVLSYNRTRLLQQGDYFAFRPVLMALLALWDMTIRTSFILQGIFNCSIAAVTATIFCQLTRRMAGILAATSLTMLWVFQLAGVEIVLWQHINPYLLAPACMFGALLLITGEQWGIKHAVYASSALLIACLTHELSVVILTSMAFFLSIDRRSGFRKRVLTTFLPAVGIALLINVIDYTYINPPPSLLGSADHVSTDLQKLIPLAGSIGSAFFRPDSIHIPLTDDFTYLWNFSRISHNNLQANAIILFVVVTTLLATLLWQLIKRGITANTLIGIFFIIFFGAVFSVAAFRVLTRGIDYMYGAGYYYSLFALSLCGLFAYMLTLCRRSLSNICVLFLVGMSLWHATVLHETISASSKNKHTLKANIHTARKLIELDSSRCFGGMDPVSVPKNFRRWSALFQDLSCMNRPHAIPLYLVSTINGLELFERSYKLQPTNINLLPVTPDSHGNIKFKTDQLISSPATFGFPVDISIQCTVPFNIIIDPANEIPYNFRVNYNELLPDNSSFYNSLLWDATKTVNVLQIQFTQENILFFGNTVLLSVVPRTRTVTGKNCRIMIVPKIPGTEMILTRFSTASHQAEPSLLKNTVYQGKGN